MCLLGFACYFCIYINEQKKEREKPNEEKIMEKGEKKSLFVNLSDLVNLHNPRIISVVDC